MRRILGTGARTGHPPHQGVSGRTGSSVSPPPRRMIVPESGIYECDCGQSHEYSTDVKGHRFPPAPGRLHRQRMEAEDCHAPQRLTWPTRTAS